MYIMAGHFLGVILVYTRNDITKLIRSIRFFGHFGSTGAGIRVLGNLTLRTLATVQNVNRT